MKYSLGILSLILFSGIALGESFYYPFSVTNKSGFVICGAVGSADTPDIQWGAVSPSSHILNGYTGLQQLYATCQAGQTWAKPENPSIIFTFSNDMCATKANSNSCTIETIANCVNGTVTFTPGSYSCTGTASIATSKDSGQNIYTLNPAQ